MIFDRRLNLTPGEAGDDRREGVHVGLEDDIVGNAPALPARMKIFNQLVHRADQYIGALEDLLGLNWVQRLANSSAAWRG